ncbi:glyoxalase superfamily protein [Bradyrhizobium sp. JR4.1]
MRDFRNAKAMAQTLRAGLAAKGIKITVSQSLELMAVMFGLADWNTLSAAIKAEKAVPRERVSSLPALQSNSSPLISGELATTLRRAIGFADQRNHEYATLEHLLLSLLEDADASASINTCNADPTGLTERLVD